MAIRTELNLRLPNSPGALAGVCRLLSDQRVNIVPLALEAFGPLRLVVGNPPHPPPLLPATAVLAAYHHQVTERDVLLVDVPNGPGALAPVLWLAADPGTNVEYAYGGASEGAQTAAIILGVDDAQRVGAAAGI